MVHIEHHTITHYTIVYHMHISARGTWLGSVLAVDHQARAPQELHHPFAQAGSVSLHAIYTHIRLYYPIKNGAFVGVPNNIMSDTA